MTPSKELSLKDKYNIFRYTQMKGMSYRDGLNKFDNGSLFEDVRKEMADGGTIPSWAPDDYKVGKLKDSDYKDRSVYIKDNRTVNPNTNKPINPKSDLKTGYYSSGIIKDITRTANQENIADIPTIKKLISISLQEDLLGKHDINYGHVASKEVPYDPDIMPGNALAWMWKHNTGIGLRRNKDKSNEMMFQYYNTPYVNKGKITQNTEPDYYHNGTPKMYGVDIPKEGVNLKTTPMYGKQLNSLYQDVISPNNTIDSLIIDEMRNNGVYVPLIYKNVK